MKKFKKRTWALALVLVLIGALLCGCNKEEQGKEDETETQTVPTGNVYVSTFSDLKGETKLNWINSVFYSDNKLYMLGDWYDKETYESKTVVLTYDLATGTQEEKFVELEENCYFNKIIATKDGIMASLSKYTPPTEEEMAQEIYEGKEEHFIAKMDKDFTITSKTSLDEIAKIVKEEQGYFYISDFAADADGNLCIVSDRTIYIMDADGTYKYNITLDNWINNIVSTPDGTVLVSYPDENYKTVVSVLDINTRKLSDPLEGFTQSGYSLFPSTDGNVYSLGTTKLTKYNINTQTSEEILDFIECDINSSNLSGFAALEDGSFICVSTSGEYDAVTDEYKTTIELATIKEVPASSVKIKKKVNMAMLYLDYDIQEKVIKFNRQNEDYKILITPYMDGSVGDDWEAVEDRFNTDLATGTSADMYLIDTNLDFYNLVAKGVFADLDQFLEKDPSIKKEDFIPGIVEALSYKGKLYLMGSSMNIQSLVGKQSIVGTNKTWTYSDVMNALKKYPNTQLMPYITRQYGLEMLLSYSLDSFYDVTTGECHFDSEDFIALLELVKAMPEEYDYDKEEYVSPSQMIRENRILVQQVWLSDFSEIQLYKELFGEPVNYVGYPTNGTSGNVASVRNMMAISAKSKNKDGAWAFMRTFLEDDYQNNLTWEIPVKKSAFEAMLQREKEKSNNEENLGSWWYDDVEIQLKPLTDEDFELIKDLVYNVNKIASTDEALLNIIKEDADAFFNGKKSAKDVASLIQSRAQLYIDENR